MSKRFRLAIGLTVVTLLVFLSGCASLLNPLHSDPLVTPEAEALSTSGVAGSSLNPGERVALRAVQESSYYNEVSASILRRSLPSVSRPTQVAYTVVFSLEPTEEGTSVDGFRIYAYVMFIVDSVTKQVLDAYKATPILSERTLFIESLARDVTYTQDMAPCVAAELAQARTAAEQRVGRDVRVQPKYECDESLTEPKTVCWCVETVPGHYDDDCLQDCADFCGVFPPPQCAICYASCYVGCWVPEYCIEVECETIYPCPW